MTDASHIDRLAKCVHNDPSQFLGPHEEGGSVVIRAYLPDAGSASVVIAKKAHAMSAMSREGFFELRLGPRKIEDLSYRIRAAYPDGGSHEFYDPYAFPPSLTEFDLHLIGEGTHYRNYEKLGAHLWKSGPAKGVQFAVWAPNARGVSVVGDFNAWDGRRHQMRLLGKSGIWEIFIPGLRAGEVYKYELRTAKGAFLKTDPYGFYAEKRPSTASVVWNINKYRWSDGEWMRARKSWDWLSAPISTYEVHLGSWMRGKDGSFLNCREIAHSLVEYVTRMGYTHIELMPVQEHPLDASWGYQAVGYFAITSRFGTPEDFMYFVDHCHQHGVGVIVDWVPAHFPKDAHGLAYFDGTFLYEHEHPFKREHMDWGTHIFNYGRNEVSSFLLNSALFWLHKYHIDGLRVDAVASMLYLDYSRKHGQWIPNKYGGRENLEAIEFLKRFNEIVHREFPGVLTIAEESTAWPMVSRPTYTGGLGFSMKWNMGWMHDVLGYFQKDPVHRKYHHGSLSFGLIYAFNENFVLVLSHDEVVHGKRSIIGKMPGDDWRKFANARLLYGFMYTHPGKKLLFMGSEFGQWAEWNFDKALDWHLLEYEPHQRLQSYTQDMNTLYKREPALYELDFDYMGFEWIDHHDADNSVLAFIRRAKDPEDFLVCVFNFTPVPRKNYRIGVPWKTVYREILNSDAAAYGGGNIGNAGQVTADPTGWKGRPYSLTLTLPPLGMLVLRPVRETVEEVSGSTPERTSKP